ncbi:hypothetical protein O8H62_001276 [Enterobacter asburiae]|nr:hypothetical protein [Enterobacter asburiae]
MSVLITYVKHYLYCLELQRFDVVFDFLNGVVLFSGEHKGDQDKGQAIPGKFALSGMAHTFGLMPAHLPGNIMHALIINGMPGLNSGVIQ